MKTAELRSKFIEFFKNRGHTFVPSSSLIPIGDQTLLFTIAGMVQFKDALTGAEVRSYKRAVNSQKCVRVPDLDNVGRNGRHHTFFEMLGNWSFGDYYKKEAIEWAYDFVRNVVKMDMGSFWASVHETDDEAFEIWKSVGVPADRIVRLGADNFWAMGPTGPCGPCSELYYDRGVGSEGDYHKRTGTKCTEKPGCDCDRFLEFWNLVFMQFDRQEDGSLPELPFKSVDTGAGLERFAALLQGKASNFEIDSFVNIKNAIRKRAELPLGAPESDAIRESLNVVADHTRMLTFTVADGCVFSNEGRGYVLRRVLRRAVRHAHRLNPSLSKERSFLPDIVSAIVAEFGEFYPEIVEQQKRVMDALHVEEQRFSRTLAVGLERFQEFADEARKSGLKALGGEKIFLLHDSFGFPSDLTRILCEENGLSADLEGFKQCMAAQKERSRAEAKFYKFEEDDSPWVVLHEGHQKEERTFAGYGIFEPSGTHAGREVVEIPFHHAQIRRVRQLRNRMVEMVVASTPFYAESGGQVADGGWIILHSGSRRQEFEVVDVRKTPGAIVHLLRHPEHSDEEAPPLTVDALRAMFQGDARALVDFTHRSAVARNHTATHLLHKALQVVMGDGVRQAGSLVSEKALRFDFTCHRALTADEILRVEEMVNREILRNRQLTTHENVPVAEAKSMGAMAIFDEKYDDHVRVVEVPDYSMELCGGTHVKATGNIGLFKIVSEGSVTAGVRRLEAITGMGAWESVAETRRELGRLASEAGCAEKDLLRRIQSLKEELKGSERAIQALESRLVNSRVAELLAGAREVASGVSVVAAVAQGAGLQELEMLTDRLKEKNIAVVVVSGTVEGKAIIFTAVNPGVVKLHKKLTAGGIAKAVSELVDGRGGGRPDFARGGGNSPEKLPHAMAQVESIVRQALG